MAALALAACALAGCGGAVSATPGEARGAGGASATSSASVCGSSPKLVVDWRTYLPQGAQLASPNGPPIAVQGNYLYFTLFAPNVTPLHELFLRVPTRGGRAVQIASVKTWSEFVLAPGSILFSEPTGQDGNAILSMPLGGGPTTVLASTTAEPGNFIVKGTNLYFIDPSNGIESLPLAGGPEHVIVTVAELVKSGPGPFQIAGDQLYLSGDQRAGGSGEDEGIIQAVPIAGGTPTTVATEPNRVACSDGPCGLDPVLIPCGDAICWINPVPSDAGAQAGELQRLAPGGAPVVLAQDAMLVVPDAAVFDGQGFFVGVGNPSVPGVPPGLIHVSANGGAPQVLAQGVVAGVAVDDACVYWSTPDGVYSLARSVADSEGTPVDAGAE